MVARARVEEIVSVKRLIAIPEKKKIACEKSVRASRVDFQNMGGGRPEKGRGKNFISGLANCAWRRDRVKRGREGDL